MLGTRSCCSNCQWGGRATGGAAAGRHPQAADSKCSSFSRLNRKASTLPEYPVSSLLPTAEASNFLRLQTEQQGFLQGSGNVCTCPS